MSTGPHLPRCAVQRELGVGATAPPTPITSVAPRLTLVLTPIALARSGIRERAESISPKKP